MYYIARSYFYFKHSVHLLYISLTLTRKGNDTIARKLTPLSHLKGMLLKAGTGNGERGTGVWERVYSGFPHNNSKWRTQEKKNTSVQVFVGEGFTS